MESTEMFEQIERLVSLARAAQEAINSYTQEEIDQVCLSVAWQVYKDENIKQLANLAVKETGMGNIGDKITKHRNKILGVINDVMKAKSVGFLEYDAERGISKYAKPVGVVGALTPVTNPTATPGSNAVSILKGKNAVIFAPHPRAKKSTMLAVEMMRDGLRKVGAPEDLIQVIAEPSIGLTNELMAQVDRILATGGGAMVKAANSSGTPAFGVGPGNSCQIVAEDADIEDMAKKVTVSKNFDYATSCSSENSLVIQASVYDASVAALRKLGAYMCNAEEKEALKNWMWRPNKKGMLSINGDIVARSSHAIAKGAGFDVPENTVMLLVEGSMPLEDDLFAREKLSPVLTLWKYHEFYEGYEILLRLINNCGRGHSCGIHSFKREYINYLAEHMPVSRMVVRQPQASANGGAFFNGMPSTVSLGCGSWGNNITTENITYKHFINVTWVSEPIPDHRPTEEQIWGGFFRRFGK
jgi:sulfoacetaldehyde dehydrogenase